MELDYLDNNNFAFITYRAHISEPQVFEDFINLFLPYISLKFPNYIYSIEDDDSPSRHIHILLQHESKDSQKLKQKLEAKYFKDFKKSLQNKQTDLRVALKFGKGPDGDDFGFTMKIEDKMKCIGYIFKDITRRNRDGGLSQSLITQCCDFYFSNRRIKNATDNDWKQLTTKNIHIKIEEYCKTTKQDVMSPLLQFNMVKDKYTFIQLSTKQRKMAFAELRYHSGFNDINIRKDLVDDFIDDQQPCPYAIGLEHENNHTRIKKLEKENESLRSTVEKQKKLIALLQNTGSVAR